ncbi:hypothetical protein SAMN02746065_102220 [Desulfocicer vacuolatum DSM 3385]|uniref:SprT-like family protein n=1 Tax=Desulfocicer vacuolatum DSM 3385 TaxID=1121400 RepID=A0A1W1ZE90_9BACT|nr:hypothetical protein [Desulfocicer vacuolatum]SMC46512.1 hypothetical protein SAMN02746065_102220 [Desulfocicer vacuolatum DSM 3385]
MPNVGFFNKKQLHQVREAVSAAEDLVSDYYKMSSAQWLRSRYEVRTAGDLESHEVVDGPFAQVLGYRACPKDASLGSASYDLYRICIQDSTILRVVSTASGDLKLFPFLLYVIVHELVHIVRFARFQQIYSCAREADCAMEEELVVHALTRRILKKISVPGLEQVFVYYRKWWADKK